MKEKFDRLMAIMREVVDLGGAAGLLGWDQQTCMPPKGAASRARQMATLQKLSHDMFVTDEVGRLLEELSPWAKELDPDSLEVCAVRQIRREYDRAVRLPGSLVAEFAKARGLAIGAWMQAKQQSDFSIFRPHLERLLELVVAQSEAVGYIGHRYDALLDRFEPGMTTADIKPVFGRLKDGLVPLVHAIARSGRPVDDTFLHREYPDAAQWDFGIGVLQSLGFDFARGRQDRSEHPFTSGLSPNDVRLTTHIQPGYIGAGLFATIHEAGHGMYAQGMPEALDGTPLQGGASSGVHESQSRMWENLVGRSFGFWQHFYPRLKEAFGTQLDGVDVNAFYRAVNRVRPSLIRVEADEVTYNLHIFVRFELEIDLLDGKLDAARLPEAWNAKIEEYLGIRPENDATGVLQDVHWASGLFGYFPTYTLGNILSVQFYNRALADHPEIPGEIAAGRFDTLLRWMNTRIHVHARKFTPTELIQRVTGGPLDVEPYLEYIQKKYAEIYF